MLLFANNEATQSGGAGYFNSHCYLVLNKASNVTFDSNKAFNGGAIFINALTNFVVKRNSSAFFCGNLVSEGGGAVHVSNRSTIILNDHIYIKFSSNNAAQYGGAIFLDATAVMVSDSNKNIINFEHNYYC